MLKTTIFKTCDILPYVLNGLIYLFLFEIFSMNVEVDILHNTSMLQDLLQICKIDWRHNYVLNLNWNIHLIS
jgi:hypothetical protein